LDVVGHGAGLLDAHEKALQLGVADFVGRRLRRQARDELARQLARSTTSAGQGSDGCAYGFGHSAAPLTAGSGSELHFSSETWYYFAILGGTKPYPTKRAQHAEITREIRKPLRRREFRKS